MTETVTTPAAEQPTNFTATFTIKINGLRTATVNGLENTVKQVDWTLIGEESEQKFELPQTTNLGDPAAEGFVPLANLTETAVAAWIEATETRLPGIKAHIQMVLDKQVAKSALTNAPMPWAPVVEEPAAPTSPAA